MPEFMLKIHPVYEQDNLLPSHASYAVKILMRLEEHMLDLNYGPIARA